MVTLFEAVTRPYNFAARKHDLGANYAEDNINRMNNYEFLQALSDALEEMGESNEQGR